MHITDDLPEPVEEHANIEIPMPDGIKLAARVWLPKSAHETPVPAVLEYIPYRKRFGTVHRDEVTHGYLSAHGYACVRVDLRGSGESEGVLEDEYLQQELDDGVAVIEWLAKQSWCDGNVGMMGISWGGFNGLQIAAMRPPALKAVMAASATDDRYSDDVHHMGGCLLGDNLSWASVMFAYNSMPPDPALVGDRWRDMWMQRLEGSGFWLEKWLNHQRRDDYWSHGSVNEDYSAIRCPVFMVSGWADGYTNTVFRLMEHLDVPRKGLVGPWAHKYPHFGEPGPAIDFLTELKRWWDRWLKGVPNGVEDEPHLRVWMQDSVPPTTYYEERPGRWVAEPTWPTENVRMRSFDLCRGRLFDPGTVPHDPMGENVAVQSPLTLGLFAGKWCSYASGPDLAHDQRQEDGGALTFETAPLDEDVEILGQAVAELTIVADKPVAQIAARISDVAPDNKATRVTFGLLNLTHRESDSDPTPLEPGKRYKVRVKLNDIAQHFPKGHSIRLSLSTSYWPLAWPAPEPARLEVDMSESRLLLPVRPARPEDEALRPLGKPMGAAANLRELIEPENHNWLVHRDLATDKSELEVVDDRGTHYHHATGLYVQTKAHEWYRSWADDWDSVKGETLWERSLARDDGWSVRTLTHTVMTSDKDNFYLQGDIDAFERECRVFCRSWRVTVPRDMV